MRFLVFTIFLFFQVTVLHSRSVEDTLLFSSIESNELCFVENIGQFECSDQSDSKGVFFKLEQPGFNIWITERGLTYQFLKWEKKINTDDFGTKTKIKNTSWKRIDMSFKNTTISKEQIFPENINREKGQTFYLKNSVEKSEVKSFKKLIIKEIYNGIDWVLFIGKNGELKSEFLIHPFADINQLTMVYEGAGDIEIKKNRIDVSTSFGNLVEGELLCFHEKDSSLVESKYSFNKNDIPSYIGFGINDINGRSNSRMNNSIFSFEVQIEVSQYDKTKELILDPELKWGSFFGGNGVDGFMAVEHDSNNNIYVTGYTTSTTFPIVDIGGFYQGNYNDGLSYGDAFILKFDQMGAIVWSTYIGGDQDDQAYDIIIDGNGNPYIVGWTNSSDFPIQNAFQPTNNGGTDGFVTKFDSDGNLLWSSFVGGSEMDRIHSVTFDTDQNVFLCGGTRSLDFPVLDAGTYYQSVFSGGSGFGQDVGGDGFILKMDANGVLLWGTYYGGSSADQASSIAIDQDDNVSIIGTTFSNDLPLNNPFQNNLAGSSDVFLSKFDNSGNLLFATYYGGLDTDRGFAVGVNNYNEIIIAGDTKSNNLPLFDIGSFFQGSYIGGGFGGVGGDAFISKFSENGNLEWGTYYGGNNFDNFSSFDGLKIDDCNNIFLILESASSDLNLISNESCHFNDLSFGGGVERDNVILKFDIQGNLLWNTYIGGNQKDSRGGITIDNNQNIFVVGEFVNYASGSSLPMLDQGGPSFFDNSPNGSDDSYILKFSTVELSVNTQVTEPNDCCNGELVFEINCDKPPYSFTWSTGDSKLNIFENTDTLKNLCAGNYWVEISSNCQDVDTLFFTLNGSQSTTFEIDIAICKGDTLQLNNVNYFLTGEYSDTIFGGAINGCDSIISLSLNVLDTMSVQIQGPGLVCVKAPSILYTSTVSSGNWTASCGVCIDSASGELDVLQAGIGTHIIYFNSDGICSDSDSIIVEIMDAPSGIIHGGDTLIYQGDEVQLDLEVDLDDDFQVQWIPSIGLNCSSCLNPVASPSSTTQYNVLITTESGCILQLLTTIYVDKDCDSVHFPTLFSPNNDGINDLFCPLGSCIESVNYKIYNRWGENIFSSTSVNNCWDGTYKGEKVNSGVYVYKCSSILSNGRLVENSGQINVLK